MKLQTEFDSPQASPGFLLWQVTNRWQARQRKALEAFDLTHVQFVLLASLVWASDEASYTQKQLAMHAKTDIMMTSQVVRMLERKGLVSRTVSITDGRSRHVRATVKGAALANRAVVAVEAVDRAFFHILGEDVAQLTGMMQRLAGEPVK